MKRLGLGLLALGLLHLALLLSGLLPPDSEEGLAAVALMEQPNQRALGLHDAFPLLWTWRRDIPLDRIETVLAEDQQGWTDALAAGGVAEPAPSRGIAAYPELPYDKTLLCPLAPESCLAWVRADVDKVRVSLQEQQTLLDRLQGLDAADYVHNNLPASMHVPMPNLAGLVGLTSTRNALLFVNGEYDAAIQRTCTDISTWRRLRNHADSLFVDMMGLIIASQQLHLLGEMLAELPANTELPATCEPALSAPQAEELDQCDVWRHEYRMNRHVGEHELFQVAGEHGWLQVISTRLLFNQRASLERVALGLSALCRGDLEYTPPPPKLLEQLYNPAGIVLADIPVASYRNYGLRARDFLALIQGLRIAVWLRGQADIAAAFAARPHTLQAYEEYISLDVTKSAIRVFLSEPRENAADTWAFPIARE